MGDFLKNETNMAKLPSLRRNVKTSVELKQAFHRQIEDLRAFERQS
jgi:hypothetical protein